MCKHIINAQVTVRAPCCQKFYDCPECHEEKEDHKLRRTMEMVFVCKKCRKAFRKDMSQYEESDEYCPHCDNHYVITAQTPTDIQPPPPPLSHILDVREEELADIAKDSDDRVDQKKEWDRQGGLAGMGKGKDLSAELELREKGKRGFVS